MNDSASALVSPLQLSFPRRPPILGIAGCSGSGKTTLARELVRSLGAALLPLDAYYRDLSRMPADERDRQNFDHPDSLEVDLLIADVEGLAAGQPVLRPIYDFATHTRMSSTVERIDPAPVVIVEGILALHYPGLLERYDLPIYVHAPEEVCLARRIHRDVRERGRTEISVREQYHATTGPMAEQFVRPSARHASLRVEGTDDLDWSVEQVIRALGQFS